VAKTPGSVDAIGVSPGWPSLRRHHPVDVITMTSLPTWTNANWTARIAEPFRSYREFWTSLAASADAVVALAVAVLAAVGLVLAGDTVWSAVPFAAPAGLAIRAAVIGRSSSRRSQASFADRQAWRDAERGAVAAAFGPTLRRPRLRAR
jgi:hypothetical protein